MNWSGHKEPRKVAHLVIWIPGSVMETLVRQAIEGASSSTWADRLLAEAAGDFWENHETVTAGDGRLPYTEATRNTQKGLVSLTWAPMEWLYQAHPGSSRSAQGCP